MHKLIRHLGIKYFKILSCLEYLSVFKLSKHNEKPVYIVKEENMWGENEFHSYICPVHFRWAMKAKLLGVGAMKCMDPDAKVKAIILNSFIILNYGVCYKICVS